MSRGTRRVHNLLFTLALCSLAALLTLLTACSPCPAVYAVGCAPFPTAAPRQ